MGATIPNTATGLWMNWLRMIPRMMYPAMILVRLPFAIFEIASAMFLQNLVRLNPAATTHMPPIMTTLLSPK